MGGNSCAANPHNQMRDMNKDRISHLDTGANRVNQSSANTQTHISRFASSTCHRSDLSYGKGTPQDTHSSNVTPPRLGDRNKLGSGKSHVSANPLPPLSALTWLNPASSPCHGGNSSRRVKHLMGMENGIKNTTTDLDTPPTHVPYALTQGGTSKAANPAKQSAVTSQGLFLPISTQPPFYQFL